MIESKYMLLNLLVDISPSTDVIYLGHSTSQVSASFDALVDIAGGKINIHVLMALAAFASVFMGNSLEGGLLLAMFNLSHIGMYPNPTLYKGSFFL